jgi:hypothetical protein
MPLTPAVTPIEVTLKDELQDARRELERRTRNLTGLLRDQHLIAQWQVACQRAIVRRLEAALVLEMRAHYVAEGGQQIAEAP